MASMTSLNLKNSQTGDSMPDFSHKSQELNITVDQKNVSDANTQILPPTPDHKAPPSKSPDSGSKLYDLKKLQEYDAERKQFTITFWIIVALAVIILILILISTVDSFEPENNATIAQVPDFTANFYIMHVMIMVTSVVFLSSLSIVLYRLLPEVPMWILKWIHGGIMFFVLILLLFGLAEAILSTLMSTHKTQFRTLHSWCGALVVLLFIIEFGSGMIFIFSPNANKLVDTFLQRFHKGLGQIIQLLVVVSVATGVVEFSDQDLVRCDTNKSKNCSMKGLLSKIYGFLIVIFFILYFVLTISGQFKRRARPKWKCIYSNPHAHDSRDGSIESSKTAISKFSFFRMKKVKNTGSWPNDHSTSVMEV